MMFSALTHPDRIRLLTAIVQAGSLGIMPTTLSEQMGISKRIVSFHLKKLRDGRLVKTAKEGTAVYYTVSKRGVEGVIKALAGLSVRSAVSDLQKQRIL